MKNVFSGRERLRKPLTGKPCLFRLLGQNRRFLALGSLCPFRLKGVLDWFKSLLRRSRSAFVRHWGFLLRMSRTASLRR